MSFNDDYKLHWSSWLHKYFFKGKTVAIYVLIFATIISAGYMVMYRKTLSDFIPYFIIVIAYYAVFTDLVAHLYYDSYSSGLTLRQFTRMVLHGRTHDVYGMLITIAMSIYLLFHSYNIELYFLIYFSAYIIFMMFWSRFYH